jgi:hypothetical protein
MKSLVRILTLTALLVGLAAAIAQKPPQPPPAPAGAEPNTPQLTLDEKIQLATDDIKRQDALEKAQKMFQEAAKPIDEHQQATIKVIEQEHAGWTLTNTAQGWQFVKKPPAPAKESQSAPPPPPSAAAPDK